MAKNQNQVATVGMDIGNGITKIVVANAKGVIKEVKIPSVVSECGETLTGHGQKGFKSGGKTYLVGDDAIELTDTKYRSIDSSYIKTDDYRIQALNALVEVGVTRCHVTTGLPVEFFNQDRKELERIIRGWKASKNNIDIVSVDVLPQPIGTYMDILCNWQGKIIGDYSTKRVGIIDIGHGTIDVIEILKSNIVPNRFKGLSVGVHTMFSAMHDFIMHQYPNLGASVHDMQDIYRNGKFEYEGKEVAFNKFIDKERKEMIKRVKSIITQTWPKGTGGLSKMVFTGGGALAIEKEIRASYPEAQVIIPDNPSFSNARGFAKKSILSRFNK